MDFGRVVCLLIATKTGDVIYERFYITLTEAEKAEMRAGLDAASAPYLAKAQDEDELVGRYKAGVVVFIPIQDVVLYTIGTGEYDELMLGYMLRMMLAGLKECLQCPINEKNLIDKYAKLVLVVDEVVNEGIIDEVRPHAIVAGTKLNPKDPVK